MTLYFQFEKFFSDEFFFHATKKTSESIKIIVIDYLYCTSDICHCIGHQSSKENTLSRKPNRKNPTTQNPTSTKRMETTLKHLKKRPRKNKTSLRNLLHKHRYN